MSVDLLNPKFLLAALPISVGYRRGIIPHRAHHSAHGKGKEETGGDQQGGELHGEAAGAADLPGGKGQDQAAYEKGDGQERERDDVDIDGRIPRLVKGARPARRN